MSEATLTPATASTQPVRVVVKESPRPKGGPLDFGDLRARGYSEPEAYALLRNHGVQVLRKRRIALEVLVRIERGELAP